MTIEKQPQSQSSELEKRLEIPIGEAKELAELTQKKWREYLLLFSQVENTVLNVNDDVYAPLKLKEGEASPLGLFVEAAFSEEPAELPKGKQALETWIQHRRSALLARVIFGDKEGRIYRDIDIKGSGYAMGDSVGKATVFKPGEERTDGGREGLLNRDTAFFDYQMSEEFLNAGVRTHRVLAIIGLKELIVGGRKLSLEEAVKEGIIDQDFQPVVEVRAFGTKARIWDLTKPILRDAKKMVSQELGYKEPFSNKEYLEWFAKTLGCNVGLIHKNGWVHNYLNFHNITLDCRIVDLDAIGAFDPNVARHDFDWAQIALSSLVAEFPEEKDKKEFYKKIFRENYNAVFPAKQER